jgi:putative PIN family toxin of toxin-antitoxin system
VPYTLTNDCIYAIIILMIVVIDTDVLVAGVRGVGDSNRVLQACLEGRLRPLIGVALFAEYEDVMGRAQLWRHTRLTAKEREELLDIFLSVCRWKRIYYAWRPNLRDEADNHIIELAVAGQARFIVTRNKRDFASGELRFPPLRAVTPAEMLKENL